MESQEQINHQGSYQAQEKLEDMAGQSDDKVPEILSKQDIMVQIDALEKLGDYFDAASILREYRDANRGMLSEEERNQMAERISGDYQKAAEKYHGFVHSNEKLLGDKVLFPKKHKVRIGDYTAIVKPYDVVASETELIPKLMIKIKGPGIRATYGSMGDFFNTDAHHPFVFSESNKVIEELKCMIGEKYNREVNQKLLGQLVNEALIPYKPRSY